MQKLNREKNPNVLKSCHRQPADVRGAKSDRVAVVLIFLGAGNGSLDSVRSDYLG